MTILFDEFLSLYNSKRFDEADALCRRALAENPDDFEAIRLLGALRIELKDPIEAIELLNRARALRPDHIETINNLGLVHWELGFPDRAEAHFRLALERGDPPLAEAHVNLGRIAQERHDFLEAERRYRTALVLKPDDVNAHYNLALVLLHQGRFTEGWREHEYRWRTNQFEKTFPTFAPTWGGEDLAGKHILIYGEQGRGDTFQFSRYLSLLQERGARVSFLIAPGFHALFQRLQGVDELLDRMHDLPPFDYQCAIMSLPYKFGTQVPTIPRNVPYLAPDPARVALWGQRLGRHGYRIAIAWQGNPTSAVEKGRSIALKHFAPLAALPNVRLISTQKNVGLEQLQSCGFPVETLGDAFDPPEAAFADSAAIMANCDLVVSSDTSITHLAGALGLPTFLALQKVPDWRWLDGREDCPWYPTMRLFRQTDFGDWRDVFDRITQAAAERMQQSTH